MPMIGLGQNDCGTIPTQQQIDYLTQTRSARQSWNQPESTIGIPVQHHVVRESNGTGGLTLGDISFVMNALNTYYANSNLNFYECSSINYINNSTYYDFDANDESVLCGSNDIQDVINIYYFNSVTSSSGSSLCGYAYFPPGPDRVIMANSCAINGSTIVHELGHYLSLYHTHGTTNTGTTTELVNGSNCSTAGDDLCDTPADPNLSGLVTNSCQYTGTSFDANGQAYVPDPTNIMSYSQKVCRTFLSSDQYNRANYSALNDRSYLTCNSAGCTDPTAFNYSTIAITDDGSCCFVSGCTDPLAVNYDPLACFDNGLCTAPVLGCTNQTASNYDPNANTGIALGGALDNTFGTGSYFNGDQHLNFDASKECVIKSAIIYSEGINSISFELRDNNGIVIDDTTLTLVAGQQSITLNFNVPIANDLQLGVSAGALANIGLYRNDASASYPYNIASAINITSSSASVAGYYYFYYNLEVETPCLNTTQVTYDCDGQGNCTDPGNGNGMYTSLNACQTNCVIPVTYDCDGQGNCTDPGNGNGMYTSLNACQTNCVIPVTYDCDGQGNCTDPGNGNGMYTSLNACQTNCIIPVTYDCDGQGNCTDPGNGNGTYTSILACQAECGSTSIPESELSNISIFPNPSDGYFTIKFRSLIIQDLKVKITNAIGEIIFIDNSENYIGGYKKQINLKNYANGIYFLEVETHKGTANKKIVLY